MHPSAAVSGQVSYDPAAAREYNRLVAPRFKPVAEGLIDLGGPGQTVLEIAAGSGSLTRHLARRLPPGAKLVATDRSPAMLTLLGTVVANRPNTELLPLDYESEFPFADASFDRIFSQFAYLHTCEPGLRECARVLTPGGRLCVAFWGSDYLELEVLSEARQAAGLEPIRPFTADAAQTLLRNVFLQTTELVEIAFPARFADIAEYIAYRRALGLPSAPGPREGDERALDLAAAAMEAKFGAGKPIDFEWRALAFSAELAALAG